MTLSLRSIIRFGLTVLIFSCVAGLGLIWSRMGELERHYVVAEKHRKFEMFLQRLYAEGAQVTLSARTLIIDPSNTRAPSNLENAVKNITQSFGELQVEAKDIGLADSFRTRLEEIRGLANSDIELQRQIIAFVLDHKIEDAAKVMKDRENGIWRKYRDDILALRKDVGELAEQKTEFARAQAAHQKRIVIGLSILLVSIAVAIYLSASRSLSRLMDYMKGLQEQVRIANGNSESLSRTSEGLSQSSQQQVAALQETVAALEQISQMAVQNSDQASSMEQLSAGSESVSREGQHAVAKVSDVIQEINHGNAEMISEIQLTNKKIEDIVQIIQDIESKTKIINDIVFQTKLLSFNASVEAARAGESGKGFAVVAEEVGSLAEMSGVAAKEITEMLMESTQKVQAIVESSRQKLDHLAASGQEKVQSGVLAVEQCGKILEDVVKSAAESGRTVKNIALASTEQTRGVQEISKAMHQLDQFANQNASASQETLSSARQMREQAESLQALLDSVLVTVRG
jgi:methyl-accepting chemotaxis protein